MTFPMSGLVDLPPALDLILHTPNYGPSTRVMNAAGRWREECDAIGELFTAVFADTFTDVTYDQHTRALSLWSACCHIFSELLHFHLPNFNFELRTTTSGRTE
ncbi:hypothetical protein DPSP01_005414 [Paraphaeosphaeria sporulosa]